MQGCCIDVCLCMSYGLNEDIHSIEFKTMDLVGRFLKALPEGRDDEPVPRAVGQLVCA